MTERAIQNALFDDLRRKGFILSCPNYTPVGWWECDLLGVTKARMFVELEIKVSRSDFKADSKKVQGGYGYQDGKFGKFPTSTKHERLALGDTKGPSRFFYVVPENLVEIEDVPEFAGLVFAIKHGTRIVFRTVKQAPKLHHEKVQDRVVQHMASVFYWRYWNLRRGIKETEVPS